MKYLGYCFSYTDKRREEKRSKGRPNNTDVAGDVLLQQQQQQQQRQAFCVTWESAYCQECV